MRSSRSALLILISTIVSATSSENDDVVHVTGLVGSNVRLPCNVTPPTLDHPAILVVWSKEPAPNPIYTYDMRTKGLKGKHWYDSFTLGGRAYFNERQNSSFLSIENLKESDGGRYRCRVDFDKAAAKIHKVDVQVVVLPDKPILLTEQGLQFREVKYFEGSHLKVDCRVKGGTPAPRIRWFVDGKEVEGGPLVTRPGALSSTLDYGLLNRKDIDVNITCSAINNDMNQSVNTSVPINILLLPEGVDITTAKNPLSAGKETVISCESWGSRPAAVITWWLGSHQIHANISQTAAKNRKNRTESKLTFIPSRNDTGKFLKCRAENPAMSASQIEDSWHLDIMYKPLVSITLGPTIDPSRIKEGDDAYFECLVVAKPPAYKVYWTFNGEELKQNMKEGVIMGNQSLVLQALPKSSTGEYRCAAVSTEGEGASTPIQLDVKYKPTCRGEPSKIYGVAKGEIVSINCTVDANPVSNLSFSWTFNNTSENADIQESRYTKNGTTSTLMYSPFHELDYGTLLCWGENRLGRQDHPCSFHIIPAGPPEPPEGCMINRSDPDSLRVSCEPGFDGGLEQSFQLEIQQVDTGNTIFNQSSLLPNFHIDKLERKHKLTVTIYSFNSKGRSGRVLLPHLNTDFLLDNGPITRAAKNTEKKADETKSEKSFKNQENLFSIILGVSVALAVVVLVIILTMTIRCGRHVNSGRNRRTSSGSSSPDFLVGPRSSEEADLQTEMSRTLSSSLTSIPSAGSRSLTLPRRNQGLLTLQSLPPPPPPVTAHGSAQLEDLQYTDLPPPPEWATAPLPPPDTFFTLPRKGGGQPAHHQRTVRFQKTGLSKSNSGLDRGSHTESAV